DGLAKAPTWDENLRAEIRRRLTAWSKLLHREPEVARQLLRRLLVGRLTLTPNAETREDEVRGEATYGQLFEGLPIVVASVPPAGVARPAPLPPGPRLQGPRRPCRSRAGPPLPASPRP